MCIRDRDKAEEAVREYRKVAKETSKWVNPLDNGYAEKVLHDREKEFFVLPGRLGQMVGNLERGFLVMVCGPEKRGKSFYLGEMAVLGLFKNLKVVFISAEMSDKKMSERIYRRLTSCGDEEGYYTYPVFDCLLNQKGTCTRKERENTVTLIENGEELPDFNAKMKYQICTYCRKRGLSDYIPAVWFMQDRRSRMDLPKVRGKIKGIKRMYGDHLRMIAYPRFEASVLDVMRDLDNLEYTEGFVPDVIITDYADIFKPENKWLTGLEATDNIWKLHANMASKRHALVFTGSQAQRGALEQKNVRMIHTAGDIRKTAHCDAGLFLSQTDKEKGIGVMRVSMFNRHRAFSESNQVRVLHQLEVGQVIMDSEYVKRRKEDDTR